MSFGQGNIYFSGVRIDLPPTLVSGADNGLHLNVDKVYLGGELLEDTSIYLDKKNFGIFESLNKNIFSIEVDNTTGFLDKIIIGQKTKRRIEILSEDNYGIYSFGLLDYAGDPLFLVNFELYGMDSVHLGNGDYSPGGPLSINMNQAGWESNFGYFYQGKGNYKIESDDNAPIRTPTILQDSRNYSYPLIVISDGTMKDIITSGMLSKEFRVALAASEKVSGVVTDNSMYAGFDNTQFKVWFESTGGGSKFTVDKNGSVGCYGITVGGNGYLTGNLNANGGIRTGGVPLWKLKDKVSGSVSFDSSNYIEVEIGGVPYKLALAV